jgi:tyrosyl-tRNA synthetase
MGKTEAGTVWLSAERTSPYQLYQYWFNVGDDDVGKCLRYLTELNRTEIESLDELRAREPEARASQIRLAEELTRLVHGDDALRSAQRAKAILFGGEIDKLSDRELVEIFPDVPSKHLSKERLAGDGLSLIDALAEAGLAKTKSEARRTIQEGGAYVNNRRLTDIEQKLSAQHLASETVMVLRRGKKRYALLRFTS